MTYTPSNAPSNDLSEAVAIIGMSARFPGAPDLHRFWRNLREGVESVTFFSEAELLASGIGPDAIRHPNYIPAAAILDGIEDFDANFFGFTPREAEVMDPQFRLFLECAWTALECAGYDSEQLDGAIGVFAGAAPSHYFLSNLLPQADKMRSAQRALSAVAQLNERDSLSTLTSFKLNLTGPSFTVQTACSTSLSAVHLACQSLLAGESDLALAGGVSLNIPHRTGYLYQEANVLSADGHCRPFDARASGTVPGSGVGVVVLKRFTDAFDERDSILAVIRGSAANNDGSQKAGYTAPSVAGQSKAITEALAVSGVTADAIDFVEAHGTGTELGDPIEVEALTRAFRRTTARNAFCAIGSLKSNMGHLDRAAGIAGLIKVVLSLQHKEIPPTLHFERANPKIDFPHSPFYVNTTVTPWPRRVHPRRAAVNALGIGGTNVHVVLEEAPDPRPTRATRPVHLFTLSAKTPSALAQMARNLLGRLQTEPGLDLADAAFTLHLGRRALDCRCFAVASSLDELATALASAAEIPRAPTKPRPRPVVFLFSSLAGARDTAGSDLLVHEPVFRESMDACAELFRPILGLDLRTAFFAAGGSARTVGEGNGNAVRTCACFALEYALARLWMRWGVQPEALSGRGVGACAAGCIAEVFSLADGASLAAALGAVLDVVPSGASPDSIDAGAFAPLRDRLGRVKLRAPRFPLLSNLAGASMTEAQARDPDFWIRQLMDPACLANELGGLPDQPERILLEVGPGDEWVTRLRRKAAPAVRLEAFSSLGGAGDRQRETAAMLATLGELWTLGQKIDWAGFHDGEARARVALPTYPFERERFWIDAPRPGLDPTRPLPLGGGRPAVDDWFYAPVWRRAPGSTPSPRSGWPPGQAWLLFLDACGLGAELAVQLGQTGARVATVEPGSEFANPREGHFTIRPAFPEDYRRLAEQLAKSGGVPTRVVHLWSVTPGGVEETGADHFERLQDAGFFSLIFWIRGLQGVGAPHAFRVDLVSNQVHDVAGGGLLCPSKATLLAACKVIPQEYRQLAFHHVDIVLPTPASRGRLISHLLRELQLPARQDSVALRGSVRWEPCYEPVAIPRPAPASLPIRQGGVYLITGGLGGVGFCLARHLAEHFKAKLVLTSRSAVPSVPAVQPAPDPSAGRTAASAPLHRVREQVEQLERLGGEVLLVPADVADRTAMEGAVLQAEARFGALHGVIYAAGSRQAAAVAGLDRSAAEPHFQAKVRGLWVLEDVLGDRELDFCLFTSSLASVLGGLGSAAYTAANLFLDAFLRQHNRNGRSLWLGVNFDSWQLAPKPASAGADAGALAFAMTVEQGIEVVERVLGSGRSESVVVSVGPLHARIDQWIRLQPAPKADATPIRAQQRRHARPNLSNPYVAPGTPDEEKIAEIWQDLLGIARVGVHDNFFELGGHSLLATELVANLREVLEVEVNMATVFERPTVASLARLLDDGSASGATYAASSARGRLRKGRKAPALSPDGTPAVP